MSDIECHRDGRVVAAHADQIDHTLLAEQRKRAVERRVVDVPGTMKLDAELVNRRFVVAHGGWPLAERQILGDFRIQARLHGQRIVCVPLILRVSCLSNTSPMQSIIAVTPASDQQSNF